MNDELDKKVLEIIRSGETRAFAILDRLVIGNSSTAMRQVDRSLQRLRKHGKIRFDKGWYIVRGQS